MTRLRVDRLQRLVRITGLIYRQQAAEVARLRAESHGISDEVGAAVACFERGSDGNVVLAQLSLARAARLRREGGEGEQRLGAQIEVAGAAFAGSKSAEGLLAQARSSADRAQSRLDLDDVLELAVSRSTASPR
jgi:hypothetical protein